MSSLERIDPILGRVRLCTRCGEEWPADREFWYFSRGKVLGHCRACWSEKSHIAYAERKNATAVAA